MAWKYLLSDVDIGDEEAEAVAAVVRSKWLSMGPLTERFEKEFAQHLSVKHAVAVSNCTTALHLALLACGVGPSDEVLLPSFTFVASANSVLYTGATPVFVDIAGENDLNICVDDLERKITSKTKAIMAVHIAGFPAALDRIVDIAAKRGLKVIEDACHAIGATYSGGKGSHLNGKKAGAIGDAGCFSFFANKNLVTGEGGMLITNDDQVAAHARLLRSHGMTKSSWDKASGRAFDYDVVGLGYNYRCTELTAAIGMIQLRKLPMNNAKRLNLVQAYRDCLADVPEIGIPYLNRLHDSSHHIFPIVLKGEGNQSAVRKSLAEQGIQTSLHYPPVHLFSHYRKLYPDVCLPNTESIAKREITLPLHALMSTDDVAEISKCVVGIVKSL